MKYLFFLISLLFSTNLYASVAEDMRISDSAGRVAVITTAGELTFSFTNSPGTNLPIAAPDIRISDDNGDVLIINSNGSLNAKFQ